MSKPKGTSITGLEQQRSSLRHWMGLQRSNVLRYVAGHPGQTSAEIAKGLGMRAQNVGQILHKAREVKRDGEGRWTLRHGR